MRTREQVDRLLDLAGVVRGFSWTRPIKDDSFYDVILDKTIADMCSMDVIVRRASTRTVAVYAEHIRRRPDVIAVLRKRCSDNDGEVAENAHAILVELGVLCPRREQAETERALPRTFVRMGRMEEAFNVPWLEAQIALAAAAPAPEREIKRTSGEGRDVVTSRIRETQTGDIEVRLICACQRSGVVTVTFGDRQSEPVLFHPFREQSIAKAILYANQRRNIVGSGVNIVIEFRQD